MSTIVATNVTTSNDTLLKTLWPQVYRTSPPTTTVTIINNSDIVYDATADKFTFTYDGVASGLFYNVTPRPVFAWTFVMKWQINNFNNVVRFGWGDISQRYEVELYVGSTAAITTFTATRVRLKYANKANTIYQILSFSPSIIYTNTNYLCAITQDDESNISFSIDGTTVFTVNKTDVLDPVTNAKLISTVDQSFNGNFAIEYFSYGSLRSGATVQGSLEISEITISNKNYFGDDVIVSGNICALTYENLENQPIISGMYNKLYNKLTHTNVALTYNNYGIEKQYPPVRTFTDNTYTVSGQSYGNGTYVISSVNVEENSSSTPFRILDGNLSTYFSATNQGLFNAQVYTGIKWSVVTPNGLIQEYAGFEITIQMPVSTLLTKLIVYSPSVRVQQHCILGSDDGQVWTEFYNQSGMDLPGYVYNTLNIPSTHVTPYKYYKYVILRVVNTTQVRPRITELYYMGREYTVDTFFSASNNRVECSTLKATTYEGLENQAIISTLHNQITSTNMWAQNGTHINNINTGNVGIGTSAPTYKLHVIGTTYFNGDATFKGGINSDNSLTHLPYSDGVNYIRGNTNMCDTGGIIRVGNNYYGGSKLNINQDGSGTYNVGQDSSGHGLFICDNVQSQRMCLGADTNNSCCYMSSIGNLVIQPSPTSSSQRVGIGIYNPSFKFEVYRAFTGLSGTVCRIFGEDNGIAGERGVRIAQKINTNDWKPLSVYNDGGEVFTVRNDNVGIGNDSPASKLDVNGTVKATALNVTGNVQAGSVTSTGIVQAGGLNIGNKVVLKTYFNEHVPNLSDWLLQRGYMVNNAFIYLSEMFGIESIDSVSKYTVFVSVKAPQIHGMNVKIQKFSNVVYITFTTQDTQQFIFTSANQAYTLQTVSIDVHAVLFQ